jgi:tryptophan synthase beta chain
VERSFKEASSEAIREWASNLETSYYLTGTAVGPHPCPSMVCEFQSVIGKETRRQAMEKWGGKPDVLIACIGSGSNAMGLFHEFIEDEDVGVYHGAMSYLLEDEEGQIIRPHSIAVG